jgi:hypothetical protein
MPSAKTRPAAAFKTTVGGYDGINGKAIAPLREFLALMSTNSRHDSEECTKGNYAAERLLPPYVGISVTLLLSLDTLTQLYDEGDWNRNG